MLWKKFSGFCLHTSRLQVGTAGLKSKWFYEDPSKDSHTARVDLKEVLNKTK